MSANEPPGALRMVHALIADFWVLNIHIQIQFTSARMICWSSLMDSLGQQGPCMVYMQFQHFLVCSNSKLESKFEPWLLKSDSLNVWCIRAKKIMMLSSKLEALFSFSEACIAPQSHLTLGFCWNLMDFTEWIYLWKMVDLPSWISRPAYWVSFF